MLVCAILLLLILLAAILSYRQEKFSANFNSALSSTEYIEYLDMGDHRTMIYSQRGNSGDTVLLLHNSPLDLGIWEPLFHTMQRISMSGSKTPNLVAYDLRGHGTAWMPVDPKYNDTNIENYAWPLSLFVEDCKKIYDKVIGGGKIKICGFGFGGIVAQKYALVYPETVSKLILLQTGIRRIPGIQTEIDILGGPSGWIAKNPHVTYLTNNESLVRQTLCDWFYLPDSSHCILDPRISKNDQINDEQAPQYNLSEALMRAGSTTTNLQTDKLLASTDFVADWENAKAVPFNIHILAATDDPLSTPEIMTSTYTTIYNNNRTLLVVLDIVHGRHGFTIMRPDYIAGIVCDDCQQISSTYTGNVIHHGY